MHGKVKKQRRLPLGGRKGQASIEYVLMLGSIMVIISAFITAFHKDIVRWFFMFVGQLLTK